MPDPVASFFEELSSKGHDPLLHHASGTLRLDLQLETGIERWYLTMAKGDLAVSHRNAKADATIRMDRKLFEGMTRAWSTSLRRSSEEYSRSTVTSTS